MSHDRSFRHGPNGLFGAPHGPDEELDRASGAALGRLRGRDDVPACRLDPRDRVRERLREQLPLARRRGKPQLEHRLHERDQLGLSGDRHALELGHGADEREVRDVDRDDLDGLGEERRVELAEVRPLEVDDARVLPERPEELSVAGVDGVDATRSGVEQRIPRSTSGAFVNWISR